MLYEKINHYASENYAVIYTAENDTMQAVRHMSQYGVKVKALVESGALTIVGRYKLYYSVETTRQPYAPEFVAQAHAQCEKEDQLQGDPCYWQC